MAFACENVSTDPFQRITLHNIMDQLNSSEFPTTTPMLFAVFGFQRVIPGFLVQCRVEVVPEAGDPIAAQTLQDMAFRPDQMTQRAVVGFQGVIWPKAGEYTVRFTSRGVKIASFLLRVVQIQPPIQPGR